MTKRLLILCAAAAFFLSPRVQAQTELIGNGGFENGPANPNPWVIEGSEVYSDSDSGTTYARTGNYVLWLGGLTDWTDDAYQTVTIPEGAASATLSFYYVVNSYDTSGTPHDYLSAQLRDTNLNTLVHLGEWSNVNADPDVAPQYYHHLTYNLQPYAGQTVQIYFASTNNSSAETSLFVDDVSITTVVSGPSDLVPQNVSVSPNPALAGGTLNVSYTVANIGGAAAPTSHTTVTIKDSANNIFAQQTFATAALGTAGSTNESHSMGLTGATAGSYNVYVTVDSNNEAGQTNTMNDTSSAVPFTVQAPAGLVINPVFDTSITGDPNAATIESTINTAIQQYEAVFSDPITVTIKFQNMGSGLGQSSTFIGNINYSDFLSALTADAKTTNDAVALAHLPSSSVNPVNGNGSVTLTTPNMRALGLNGDTGGQPDSTISLNLSIMNLSRTSIDPNKYDLMAVAEHEIDEALSLGSSLNGLANGAPAPTGPVHLMDLFRYDQNGVRSLNTTAASEAYFSLDGVTDLVRFNQQQGGDFQDWYSIGSHTPRVQDANGTPGATPNLGVELVALDASGYNLVSAIPTPTITSAQKSGDTITITWASQANLNYQLQYKTNVTQVGWLNLGGAITATGSTASTSDTISDTQRYYRVAVLTASSSIVQKLVSEPPTLSVMTNYFRPAIGL